MKFHKKLRVFGAFLCGFGVSSKATRLKFEPRAKVGIWTNDLASSRSMVNLECKHSRSHYRFTTCMHFNLTLFCVLTQDYSMCFWVSNGIKYLMSVLYSHVGLDLHFPILSFSLWPTLSLLPFSILRTKYSSLAISSFHYPFVLNYQHSVLVCPCNYPFSWLALFLLNFI